MCVAITLLYSQNRYAASTMSKTFSTVNPIMAAISSGETPLWNSSMISRLRAVMLDSCVCCNNSIITPKEPVLPSPFNLTGYCCISFDSMRCQNATSSSVPSPALRKHSASSHLSRTVRNSASASSPVSLIEISSMCAPVKIQL